MVSDLPPFDRLHPLLRHHIVNTLGWSGLRPLQERSIDAILDGSHALLIAPTAGGKTEAAVFPLLSSLLNGGQAGCAVLYICPLRALLNNLFDRLEGYCAMVGLQAGIWHGDVPAHHKRRLTAKPPHILLTTPESLEGMLISQRTEGRECLKSVRAAVIDEIHAFARDDRGTHLLGLLERVQDLAGRTLQRIGLSATVGNPEALLSWLVNKGEGGREVITAEAGQPEIDIQLDYVGNLSNAALVISRLHLGEKRLVFCDSRRQVEELGAALRALGVETFLSHSSLSRERRQAAEKAFAESGNCVIVSTSTLELGIDVGDLDRVIQIDSPGTVASFLQRLGRTGRRSGTVRNCLFLATSQRSFLQAAGLLKLWRTGYVEPVTAPPFPAHLVAQQLIAMVLQKGRIAKNVCFDSVNRVASFADIEAPVKEAILGHLIDKGFLTDQEGFLLLGDTSTAEYGRRNFLELVSAFTTPPLFLVLHGNRELGSIDQGLLRNPDASGRRLLRLAGADWEVVSIDWEKRSVHAVPSAEPGRPLWLGRQASLSYALCRSMRELLLESTLPSWLTKRGCQALMEARDGTYGFLRDGRSCVRLEKGVEFFTFAGEDLNEVMAGALASGLSVETRFTGISIRIPRSGGVLYSEIKACLQKLHESTLPLAVEPDPRWLDRLKFSECLPDEISRQVFVRRLDISGWEDFKSTL